MMGFISANAFKNNPLQIEYVGGLVIKANDPQILRDYYSHFSMEFFEVQGNYYAGIPSKAGLIHIGIEKSNDHIQNTSSVQFTFKVNNFDEFIKDLERKGIKNLGIINAGNEGRFAAFRDPQGNSFAIWGD